MSESAARMARFEKSIRLSTTPTVCCGAMHEVHFINAVLFWRCAQCKHLTMYTCGACGDVIMRNQTTGVFNCEICNVRSMDLIFIGKDDIDDPPPYRYLPCPFCDGAVTQTIDRHDSMPVVTCDDCHRVVRKACPECLRLDVHSMRTGELTTHDCEYEKMLVLEQLRAERQP